MKDLLRPASCEDKPAIDDLVQDYLKELSAFSDDIGKKDRYIYPYLDHYWQDPNRYPYLIKLAEKTIGFILVRRDADPENGSGLMEIAELFVLPEFRGQGYARKVAQEVWANFQGIWRICVLEKNQLAYQFWRVLISQADPASNEESPSAKTNHQTVFYMKT